MAKKTVATLQTASKRLTKAIQNGKNLQKQVLTHLLESIMTPEEVDSFTKKNNL